MPHFPLVSYKVGHPARIDLQIQVPERVRVPVGAFDFEGITQTLPTTTFEGEYETHVGDKRVVLNRWGPATPPATSWSMCPTRS